MKLSPFRRIPAPLKAFALWMIGAFAFLQSLLTVIAWWQGTLTDPGLLDIFWLGMAPVMAYLYLRHASIFGNKQPACLLPQDDKPKTGADPGNEG